MLVVSLSSPYVVKYYGSYFKNTDLWIVMEYCGAGSVSDIIRLRNKTVSRLNGVLWEEFCFSAKDTYDVFSRFVDSSRKTRLLLSLNPH